MGEADKNRGEVIMAFLIIDGHGKICHSTFNFKREHKKRCSLYSYVNPGTAGITVRQSGAYINTAISGNIPINYYKLYHSRVGGTDIPDYRLGGQIGTPWVINIPADWNRCETVICGVQVDISSSTDRVHASDRVFFKISDGERKTLLLSQILNYFNKKSYKVLWAACL